MVKGGDLKTPPAVSFVHLTEAKMYRCAMTAWGLGTHCATHGLDQCATCADKTLFDETPRVVERRLKEDTVKTETVGVTHPPREEAPGPIG